MASPRLSPFSVFLVLCLASFPPLLQSQQPYIGAFTADCTNQHNDSSGLGYFCNGVSASCSAYLTFNSQAPYQSVSAISNLLGADPPQLAQANNVTLAASFTTGRKVIVPVNCSCAGGYYQAASSPYLVQRGDTYMTIANDRFQGLSTCQALQNRNTSSSNGFLFAGINITVPLRCACPTRNQSDDGIRYLLSFVVDEGSSVEIISSQLRVTTQHVVDANELPSGLRPTIYPNTTLLVPLSREPVAFQLSAPPPPPPPPPAAPGGSSSRAGVYVGIGVGFSVLAGLVSIGVFCVLRRRKKKRDDAWTVAGGPSKSEFYGSSGTEKPKVGKIDQEVFLGISEVASALKVYKYEELRLATEDFGAECKIDGSVYRADLNGDVAAVKKMNRDVSQEISILKKINHFNLIGLSGVCFNEGTWFLVYEYMENGSLSSWVHDMTGCRVLNWIQRVQIALDVANGLHYLHCYTEPPLVHKGIKSSNILLDGNLRAKIGNFSLARPTGGDKGDQFLFTRHIVGTVGCMAPEYLEHGLISPKLDVYAFGVMMLEIFTGKEANSLLMKALAALFGEEDPTEKLKSFLDQLLEGDYPLDLAQITLKLIDGCLRKEAGSRPTMEEVANSLSRTLAISLTWVEYENPAESQSFL